MTLIRARLAKRSEFMLGCLGRCMRYETDPGCVKESRRSMKYFVPRTLAPISPACIVIDEEGN